MKTVDLTVAVRMGLMAAISGCSGGDPGGEVDAAESSVVLCGRLPSGASLSAGQTLASCSGRVSLVMRTEGNLVLRRDARVLFDTHTSGYGAYGQFYRGREALMQTDGNFVVRGKTCQSRDVVSSGGALDCNAATPVTTVWASNTQGHRGAFLSVTDDAKLVVSSPDGTVHRRWPL